jgi:hypothetical protein
LNLASNPALRKRIALTIVAAAAFALYFTLSPRWPKDLALHVVLGDAAPRIVEVRIRYAEERGAEGKGERAEDWTREASFRYPLKSAPRVVTHATRLPDGNYVVEIDLLSPTGGSTVRRPITFQGGAASVDVSREVTP